MKSRLSSFIFSVLAILVIIAYSPVFAEDKAAVPDAKADVKPAGFTISRFVVATDVQAREPVSVVDTFPASTDKVYCFLEAADVIEETTVECVWYLNNAQMRASTLSLSKGSRWRTYANKTVAGQRGDWRVDLRDAKGTILKSVSFKVE